MENSAYVAGLVSISEAKYADAQRGDNSMWTRVLCAYESLDLLCRAVQAKHESTSTIRRNQFEEACALSGVPELERRSLMALGRLCQEQYSGIEPRRRSLNSALKLLRSLRPVLHRAL